MRREGGFAVRGHHIRGLAQGAEPRVDLAGRDDLAVNDEAGALHAGDGQNRTTGASRTLLSPLWTGRAGLGLTEKFLVDANRVTLWYGRQIG